MKSSDWSQERDEICTTGMTKSKLEPLVYCSKKWICPNNLAKDTAILVIKKKGLMGGRGDWGEDLKNSKSKKTANIIITYNRATKYRQTWETHS